MMCNNYLYLSHLYKFLVSYLYLSLLVYWVSQSVLNKYVMTVLQRVFINNPFKEQALHLKSTVLKKGRILSYIIYSLFINIQNSEAPLMKSLHIY